MLAIMVMKAMQIHSRRGLSLGSLANLYFAHSELHSPQIERTIHGLLRKAQIHASCRAIHGLCKSMLCAQHIHYTCMHMILFNLIHYLTDFKAAEPGLLGILLVVSPDKSLKLVNSQVQYY